MLNNFQSLLLILTIFSIIFIGNYLFIKYFTFNNDINNKNNINNNSNNNNNNKDIITKKVKEDFINNSMGSILILFGGLKLYDLNRFSEIFLKYNLISQKLYIYSYIYPFIEIILGLVLFIKYQLNITYFLISILMTISLLSVSISLYKGQKLRCGCLGSFFHLPLSYVTISENVLMLFMILNITSF